MIKEITINNYKSITDLTLSLGKFNVFIGENGSGKTNILEAIGMFIAAKNSRLNIEDLVGLGIRVAKPNLVFSSFLSKEDNDTIHFKTLFEDSDTKKITEGISNISCKSPNDLYGKWFDKEHGSLDDLIKSAEKLKRSLNNKKDLSDINSSKLNSSLSYLKDGLAFAKHTENFVIYNLNSQALRGITTESLKSPLGIYGERLDLLISSLSEDEMQKIKNFRYIISWLDDIILDKDNLLKLSGLTVEGNSSIYFSDKFMKEGNKFNIENANEGILHVLFYLVLFISEKTPRFFAIDNIETALNPQLCRHLTEILSTINDTKQALITTHNPAILDGLDLTNDDIRLFEVKRNDSGETKCRRIQFKKGIDSKQFKLSEMWMKGLLGAIPNNF